MQNPNPSFLIAHHTEIRVADPHRVVLSIPALQQGDGPLEEKALLRAGPVSMAGKFTIKEHLRLLDARGQHDSRRPLLVLGLRNSLVNPRAPVIRQGKIHALRGERPDESARPYYGLGLRNGRIVLDRALGGTNPAESWPEFFCAAVPVLWDDLEGEALFDALLTEASDHSHVFHLPRGNHPEATDGTRRTWQRLHEVFLENLHADSAAAAMAMRAEVAAARPALRRADTYLHAVIGQTDPGELRCVFVNDRLESIGRAMAEGGCRRAVCVENSGSVGPTYFPDGSDGDAIPLLRAPNYRPKGRAILAIELEDSTFGIPSCANANSSSRCSTT